MIDNLTALHARDDLLELARWYPQLEARLEPKRSGTHMPGVTATVPIDVHVSDVLLEIARAAHLYAAILTAETHDFAEWCWQHWGTSEPTVPQLLTAVAHRYGHFTHADDQKLAIDFVDTAHELHRKASRIINEPDPPQYLGACPNTNHEGAGCPGELYLRPDRDAGACPVCGTEYTRETQQQFLATEMDGLLLTLSDISSALHVALGEQVGYQVVRGWARRGRLAERGDGLYSFSEALDLANQRNTRRSA